MADDDVTFVTLPEFRDALTAAGGNGSRTARELPEARLTFHLENSTAEVAGSLTGFTLPTTPEESPDLLRAIVTGLAGYDATLEWNNSQDLTAQDPVVLRYQRARDLLARLVAGKLVIPGVTPEDTTGLDGDAAIYQGGIDVDLAGGWARDTSPWGGYGGRHW